MTHPDKAVEDGYNNSLQAADMWEYRKALWAAWDFVYMEASDATAGGKQSGQAKVHSAEPVQDLRGGFDPANALPRQQGEEG